jgi:hypothetical protein
LTIPLSLLDLGASDAINFGGHAIKLGLGLMPRLLELRRGNTQHKAVSLSRRTATIRFAGRVHEKLATEKTEEFKAWLSKNGLTPKSNFVVVLYNPPFIPGFLRRNEIIMDI